MPTRNALTEEQIDRLLQGMADSFARQLRAPILPMLGWYATHMQ